MIVEIMTFLLAGITIFLLGGSNLEQGDKLICIFLNIIIVYISQRDIKFDLKQIKEKKEQ